MVILLIKTLAILIDYGTTTDALHAKLLMLEDCYRNVLTNTERNEH